MTRFEFKKSPMASIFASAPGTYVVGADGRYRICCPKCSGTGTLDKHTVSENGEINPSVVCPCGWHEFAKLDMVGGND